MTDLQNELKTFYYDINQEIINKAAINEDEDFRENTFTEIYIDYLVEAAEIEYGNPCYYSSSEVKVNGYCYPEDESVLILFVSHYQNEAEPYSLTSEEAKAILQKAKEFYLKCTKGFYAQLEDAFGTFDIAKYIYEQQKKIQAVNIMLLTNALAPSMYLPTEETKQASFIYQVWDIERLYHLLDDPMGRERIEFTLKEFGCDGLTCVRIKTPKREYDDKEGNKYKSGGYTSYFTVIPGDVLFKIYEQYNARLLEKNVRTFLQARGGVNKGIKETILSQPEMFLAYNNGISGTAESVSLEELNQNTCLITGMKDFQIVNGGQTTASIFNTCIKNRLPLSSINVQAKITVLDDQSQMETVVPKISQYANSQNIVQKADFSTNDDFHLQLEKLSRNTWAPAKDGAEQQTKWFYERARGQYADTRSRSKNNKYFDSIYPKKQYFDKLQLARYCNAWDQYPYVTSKGGQANFGDFTIRLTKEHKNLIPDVKYYHEVIAKAILYLNVRNIVKNQDFSGFWSAISDYTMSYISYATGKRLNLERIWVEQDISDSLKKDIASISKAIYDYLIQNANGRNIQQWCKQKSCWEEIKSDLRIELSKETLSSLFSASQSNSEKNDQQTSNDVINPETLLINDLSKVDADIWGSISSWGKETGSLASFQNGIAYSLAKSKRHGKQMSYKQARQGIKILSIAYTNGFVKGDDIKVIIDKYPDELDR